MVAERLRKMVKSMLKTRKQVLTVDFVFHQMLYYICVLGGEMPCTRRLRKLSPILIASLRERFEAHCQNYARRVWEWRDKVRSQHPRRKRLYSFSQMQEITCRFELEEMLEVFADKYLEEFWPHDPQTHSVKKDLDYILGIRTRDPTDSSEFATGPDHHLSIDEILEKNPSGQNEGETTSD